MARIVLWEMLLLSLIIYLPWLQGAFGTAHLPLADWLLIACPLSTIWPVLELTKWMLRHGWLGEMNLYCRLVY